MKTLKLDSSYRPIEIITAEEAFGMIYMGRANLVEQYDNKSFTTTTTSYPVPCVISLNRFVKISKSPLRCNKRNVIWRDRNTCQYCRRIFSANDLTLDHVTPKSRGGPKSWDNIVTSCNKCNQIKGNRTPREAGMIPMRVPTRPPIHVFEILSPDDAHPKWKTYLTAYGYDI